MGYIIVNTDGKAIQRRVFLEFFKDRENLIRRRVLAAQTEAAAHDNRAELGIIESTLNIEIQRFAQGARFLRMVENRNFLHGLRHKLEEVLDGERTIEMYAHQADFFALLVEVIHRFLYSLADRTHGNDDAVGVFGTIVVEQVMFTARDFGHVSHSFFHKIRQSFIELIGGFAFLEVYVRILGSAADNRMIRIQRTAAEFFYRFPVENLAQIVIIHNFNLLNFMGSTETIKEVDEGYAALDGYEMCYSSQIHDFLHTGFAEHGAAGLTGSHDILMVAEDIEGVSGKGAGGYVEHARQQFTRYLVKIRNHKQESLRCSVCRRQGTSLQGTMYGTGSASLRL